MTKRCSKCEQIKSDDEFYSHKKSYDGLRPDCKKCKVELVKRHYAKNAVSPEWRRKQNKNKKICIARQLKENPIKFRTRLRATKLMQRHKITLEDYDCLFKKQKGLCERCQKKESVISGNSKKLTHLSVDKPNNGPVRLVCMKCRWALSIARSIIPKSLLKSELK